MKKLNFEILKLWAKALWLYIWNIPFCKNKKVVDRIEFAGEIDEDEWVEHRWYVKPRPLTHFIILPFLLPLIIIGGALYGIFWYISHIYTYKSAWVVLKSDKLKFKDKLDVLLSLK